MRHALYWELMNAEFGAVRAQSLHSDLALTSLGSITPEQAFSRGGLPRDIWRAVCEATGVPPERVWGRDKPRSTSL